MTAALRLTTTLAFGCALLAAAGCANRLAFGTATKVGLDISQRPDQSVELSFGYDRMEVIVIPATATDAAGNAVPDARDGQDTYSVLGSFHVKHGNPFTGQGLYIHQFFATGRAAVEASKKPGFRSRFGTVAGDIYGQGKKETTSATPPGTR